MIKRFFGWLIFIVIAGITLYLLFVIYADYSQGKRAGRLIKMSEKGVLFKTFEGQLNTGGFSGDDGDITSSIWHFSVRRNEEKVLTDIDEAIDGGFRIKLYYREKYARLFFLGDTKYYVYKVERVKD
jgi:hypothetical protein